MKRLAPILFIWLLLLGTACSSREETEPTAVATNTPRPTATYTPTPTTTPEPTSTPSPTPTPGPLSPETIFSQVSPSIAFVDTSFGSGSGLLVEGGYILTNAHVVWPFEKARIVFSDGSEEEEVPLFGWDLIADLALLGPIETGLTPLSFENGEDLVIGSDVYLIGYPGEVDEYPQPTITRGLISRVREWDGIGMTYFQTDATVAGGQSGGVLVTDRGAVIGLSGFYFSEAGYGLIGSGADITSRIEGLMAGEDVARLGERRIPMDRGRTSHTGLLQNSFDTSVYVVNEPKGTDIQLEVTGKKDLSLVVLDLLGEAVIWDNALAETKNGMATTEFDAPYFAVIFAEYDRFSAFEITSDHDLILLEDQDDGRAVTIGEPLYGSLDYPSDYDSFGIDLLRGEIVHLSLDSVLIDPLISITYKGAADDQMVYDDDSGGGLFGANAELTFKAPHSGHYMIGVQGAYYDDVGGYILTVDEPYDGAPTPMAPPPTPTPIASPFGPMALFESPYHRLTMEYPADWIQDSTLDENVFCRISVCYAGSQGALLIFSEEDLNDYGMADMSVSDYVDLSISLIDMAGETPFSVQLISRAPFESDYGVKGERLMLNMALEDMSFRIIRLITLDRGVAFNVAFMVPEHALADLQPLIDYAFSSLRLSLN